MTRGLLAFLCGTMLIAPTMAQMPPPLPASAPDLTAHYGPDPLQVGELRLPAGKGPFPVAVVVHGGCWTKGYAQYKDIAAFAEALTKRGIATWNVEYRQAGDPGGGWPNTFADVGAAVDYLRTLARTQPLDLARVVLVGHSAGAHEVLWAASRAKTSATSPLHVADPLPIKAVVAIDGPGAIGPFVGIDAEVCGKPVIVPLMGGTPAQQPARYADVSALDRLPLHVSQYLVLAALGPLMQPYIAAAKASGDPVETLTPPGADHFDIITPPTKNGQAVIDFIVTRAFERPGAK